MRRLILRSFQSPGDVLMLTAAVRDLHAAHPNQFQTDVRTSAPTLWENNPFLTPLQEGGRDVEALDVHYPLVHQSNQRPYHFLHGYAQFLEEQLGVRIPLTRFHGDIHLSPEEKALPAPGAEHGVPERFWIVMAGGKFDFTAKWWNPASWQAVVDWGRGSGNGGSGRVAEWQSGKVEEGNGNSVPSLCHSATLPLHKLRPVRRARALAS